MSENFETLAIRTQTERTQFDEHSTPLYLTSSFVFEDAEDMRASFAEEKEKNLYSRFSNPNVTEFVDKIVKMEGAESGYAFATGMSAIYSTFATLLNAGDHIVSCQSVFGSTHTLFTKYFPKWNIETTYFKAEDAENVEQYIKPNTKILYLETPTNPAIEVLDLEFFGQIAKKHNLIFIVDNCFATPYLQQPIKYGADIVSADIKDMYFNMREKIEPVIHIVELAKEAMVNLGITPKTTPVRGGTDGARLSFMGLPCPNIFTGGHNFHGKFEFLPVESLVKSAAVVVEIARLATKK